MFLVADKGNEAEDAGPFYRFSEFSLMFGANAAFSLRHDFCLRV